MKRLWRMIERYYPWLLDWVSGSDKHPSVFSDPVCTKQAGDHPPRAVPGFPQ